MIIQKYCTPEINTLNIWRRVHRTKNYEVKRETSWGWAGPILGMGNVSKCNHLFSMFFKMPMYRNTNRIAICQINSSNFLKHWLSNRCQCFQNCKGCFFRCVTIISMYSRCFQIVQMMRIQNQKAHKIVTYRFWIHLETYSC